MCDRARERRKMKELGIHCLPDKILLQRPHTQTSDRHYDVFEILLLISCFTFKHPHLSMCVHDCTRVNAPPAPIFAQNTYDQTALFDLWILHYSLSLIPAHTNRPKLACNCTVNPRQGFANGRHLGLRLEPGRPTTQLIIDVLSDTHASFVFGEDAEWPCTLSQKNRHTHTQTHYYYCH